MLIKGNAKVLGVHRVGIEHSIFLQTFVVALDTKPGKASETLSAGDEVEVEIRTGNHAASALAAVVVAKP